MIAEPTPEWMASAECAGCDPELFYPDGTKGRKAREQTAAAKKVCSVCRVRVECLLYALNQGEEWGIWGGLDEDERFAVRRGRRRLVAAS